MLALADMFHLFVNILARLGGWRLAGAPIRTRPLQRFTDRGPIRTTCTTTRQSDVIGVH
jgi:hypothetical protein